MASLSGKKAAFAGGALALLLFGGLVATRSRDSGRAGKGRLSAPEQAFKYLPKERLFSGRGLEAKSAAAGPGSPAGLGSSAERFPGPEKASPVQDGARPEPSGRYALVRGMDGGSGVGSVPGHQSRGTGTGPGASAGSAPALDGGGETGPGPAGPTAKAGATADAGAMADAGRMAAAGRTAEAGPMADAGRMAHAGKMAAAGETAALRKGGAAGKLRAMAGSLAKAALGPEEDTDPGPRRMAPEVDDVDGDTVYNYVSEDKVDVYSDLEGLESQDTKTVGGRKLRLGTQLLKGEKVTVNGPAKNGMVEVYIPGQDMRGWIPASALSGDKGLAESFPVRKVPPGRGPDPSNPLREAFVEETAKLEGVPYKWGGRSPKGVDCSGLVQLAASHVGLGGVIPRTSRQQKASSQPVHPRDLRRGDLVFTSKTQDRRISHVVVYLGNGQIREAPHTGSVVQTRNFTRRFGFDPSQVQEYDANNGVKHGKYYLFFGTYFK